MANRMFADQKMKKMTEVQKLTWALVDECATEKKVRRLERLLLDDEEARRTYIMCIQMHVDLHFLLNPPPPLPIFLQKIIEAENAKRLQMDRTPVVASLRPTLTHHLPAGACSSATTSARF